MTKPLLISKEINAKVLDRLIKQSKENIVLFGYQCTFWSKRYSENRENSEIKQIQELTMKKLDEENKWIEFLLNEK